MSSAAKARIAFLIAIGLLLACGLVVYGTARAFTDSERSLLKVARNQALLGNTEAEVAAAAKARFTYLLGGGDAALDEYKRSAGLIEQLLSQLREGVQDDPRELAEYQKLQALISERMKFWEASIREKQLGAPADASFAPDLERQSSAFAEALVTVTQALRKEQASELAARREAARLHFAVAGVFVAISFATSVLLLFWHYRLVREELEARERAEAQAREAAATASAAEHRARESESVALASNQAARRLSARLLSLQDEERRRLSRDLHDSTGQYLAAAKMVLAPLAAAHPEDRSLTESLDLIDRSLREIRTISHLLHPTGLEEAGFSVAARWYAEGFASRSGIQLKVDVADIPERLPREVEITLFRVLQEALTNIHRHSGSHVAEITFRSEGQNLVLAVRDFGNGIGPETLERFRAAGASGVGLAGMRERIREVDGTLEIESNADGTCLRAILPGKTPTVQEASRKATESA
jgi:signal transduction histidine kinase